MAYGILPTILSNSRPQEAEEYTIYHLFRPDEATTVGRGVKDVLVEVASGAHILAHCALLLG